MKKIIATLLLALALPAAALTKTRYRAIEGAPVNVLDFGAKGDDSNDDTSAIALAQAAAAASGAELYFPPGTYKINPTAHTAWLSWVNKKNVHIRGAGAILHDVSAPTSDPFTEIFRFDGVAGVHVEGIEYLGTALANPDAAAPNGIGYSGPIVFRAINGSTNINIKSKITNARYGVQSGEYADYTKGGCKGFHLDISGSMIGYPIALYLADDVIADINVDGFHRAAYLAGVAGGRIDVKSKNQHIANVIVDLTDSQTSGSDTSRGCSGLWVRSKDMGSTVFTTGATLVGILTQRADPGTQFTNLDLNCEATSTDTVAATLGCFSIVGGGSTAGYPFDWEQTMALRNIRVSGHLDKSAMTTDQDTTGAVYVQAFHTGSHYPLVHNLVFKDLVIFPSPASTRASYVIVPGLQDRVLFDNVTTPGLNWNLASAATAPMTFRDSKVGKLLSGGTVSLSLANSTVTSIDDSMTTTMYSDNATIGTGGPVLRTKQITLTGLSGASVNWASAIPAGALVLGVSGVVTTTITGSTGFQVGIGSDLTRYVNTNTLTSGFAFSSANSTLTTPQFNGVSATTIVVTAKTSNFTGGALRLLLTYWDFPALTP